MGADTKESGLTINNMAMGKKSGQITVIIKVIIMKAKNTEKEGWNLKIKVSMKEISSKTS